MGWARGAIAAMGARGWDAEAIRCKQMGPVGAGPLGSGLEI